MPQTKSVQDFFDDARKTYGSRYEGYLIMPVIGHQFYRRHSQTELNCCVLGAAYWQNLPDNNGFTRDTVFNKKSTSFMRKEYIAIYPWMDEIVIGCPPEWHVTLYEPTVWHVIQILWDGYLHERDVHERDWDLALDRLQAIIEGLFQDAV